MKVLLGFFIIMMFFFAQARGWSTLDYDDDGEDLDLEIGRREDDVEITKDDHNYWYTNLIMLAIILFGTAVAVSNRVAGGSDTYGALIFIIFGIIAFFSQYAGNNIDFYTSQDPALVIAAMILVVAYLVALKGAVDWWQFQINHSDQFVAAFMVLITAYLIYTFADDIPSMLILLAAMLALLIVTFGPDYQFTARGTDAESNIAVLAACAIFAMGVSSTSTIAAMN